MAAVGEAEGAGMLIVCANIEQIHGFKFQGLGRFPLADPDAFESYEPGLSWANDFYEGERTSDRLLVPMDSRTTASPTGQGEYVFLREGGWSWSIPYIAGLYALAAESRWHTEERLQGLLSHEIGHLAHMAWRNEWERFEGAEQNPLFQLYSEGFAQRCEHIILGREAWHQAQDESWINWCEAHSGWLAQEFLKRLENLSSVRDFFGSWFDIQGRKETGYFLGYEFIRNLEKSYTVREIALFDEKEVEERAIRFLTNECSRGNTRTYRFDETN